MSDIRIAAPQRAGPGEVVEIKTLIRHRMESGFRRDSRGQIVPRDILTRFSCRYLGREVFSAELFPAVAANPFLSFYLTATESGTLEFRWTDQHGNSFVDSREIEVG